MDSNGIGLIESPGSASRKMICPASLAFEKIAFILPLFAGDVVEKIDFLAVHRLYAPPTQFITKPATFVVNRKGHMLLLSCRVVVLKADLARLS